MFPWLKSKKIFLDYASATPVREEVLEAMKPYARENFYHPSAIYQEGREVLTQVEDFRTQIARMFGAQKRGVIFTSGGTEANTWAVRGVKQGHMIIDTDSHPSVSESIQGDNFSLWEPSQPLPVREDTTLVSSVATDNKLSRQIREIRRSTQKSYPLLHVDATQSVQYYPVGLETLGCDLISVDAGKIYGPKGIGALIVRKGVTLDLPPQGTPPVALIAGFVKALELVVRDRESETKRLQKLAEDFAQELKLALPEVEVSLRLPNIILLSLPNVLPEYLVLALETEGILVSAGPACNANKPEPRDTPVRISLGRNTTKKDLQLALKAICRGVKNVIK
jgi:cysteine desulfurase